MIPRELNGGLDRSQGAAGIFPRVVKEDSHGPRISTWNRLGGSLTGSLRGDPQLIARTAIRTSAQRRLRLAHVLGERKGLRGRGATPTEGSQQPDVPSGSRYDGDGIIRSGDKVFVDAAVDMRRRAHAGEAEG